MTHRAVETTVLLLLGAVLAIVVGTAAGQFITSTFTQATKVLQVPPR